MAGLAYPTDFVGKLELFEFIEHPSGIREEVWLADTFVATCLWFASNDSELPNTILYKHEQLP